MIDLNSPLGNTQPVAAEVSSEHLDDLLTQIEDELHSSPVYSLSLMNLQKLLGHAATKGDIMIRAVGREAIQIALKHMALGYRNLAQNPEIQTSSLSLPGDQTEASPPSEEPQLPAETGSVSSSSSPQIPVVQDTDIEETTTVVSPLESVAGGCSPKSHIKSTPPTSTPKTEKPETTDSAQQNKKKKRTKADITAQQIQQRTDYLRQVGEQFQQARQALGLSQCELHRSTMVPLSHLEALEIAQEDQLPEDVYLRGFICRLGNALGLDGNAMAAALPAPDPLQSLTPSWSSPEPETGFYLNPVHLYLGYAALLAGSIGGIALLSQQGIPEDSLVPDVPEIPTNTSPQSHRTVEPELTPGLQMAEEGIILGADIAPPEAVRAQSISQDTISLS